jgi:cysteine desulfurase/selenocysteine lyase
VTFTVDGRKPLEIKQLLKNKKINVTVAPKSYTLLDMERRRFYDGLVRASVHYYNSEEEIDLFCRTLETMI